MSGRRDDRPGRHFESSDQNPTLIHDPNQDNTDPDAKVHPRAMVVRKPSLLASDVARPLVAAGLPVGMASTEQVDGFRELRTRLLAMAHGVGLTQFTTLVTGLDSGAGASFIARNLAAAFALEDGRISLLVDCNARRPTQHLALGARASDGGLFDFLDNPHGAFERLIRPTGVPGLHLIPAGHAGSPLREYFSSRPMKSLMAAIKAEPCYVFLDAPAAKGSPDARILSEMADFIIMVVAAGRSTSDSVAKTAALFEPAKFAGVVFNERRG